MFDKLKGMGSLMGLLGNLPKIQEEMAQMQERQAQATAEGDAGAGMVKVKVNGKFDLVSCSISDEAMKLDDREMLQDLIKSAVNQAIAKAREAGQAEMGKTLSNLGLPPGFKLPGMG
jgi:DNA-binding YbaB/EbfC family protein